MKKPLYISIVLGVLSALFAGLYLDSLERTYKNTYEKEKVLIARQYIDQGILLDDTMVEEQYVPKAYIQPRAVQSIKELRDYEGRRIFMTMVPVAKGEQLSTTKLFMLGLDTGLSAVVPADKRAVTLVCDRQDISGIIKPGNRVDVIGVFDYEDKTNRMQQASATILQNILVLSVDKTFFGGDSSVDAKKQNNSFSESTEGKIPVSLSLTPQEGETLMLAAEKGIIKFALRGMGDDRVIQTAGSKLQDFIKDSSASVAVKPSEKDNDADSYLLEMRRKQREALELLNKYKRK